MINPGAPMTVTAAIQGDTDCSADSRLDKVEARYVAIR